MTNGRKIGITVFRAVHGDCLGIYRIQRDFVDIIIGRYISMNKTELIAAVADNAELSKKDAEKALKAFVDVVTSELKKAKKFS